MKQLKLRLARPDEVRTVVEWLNATPNNLYDPGMLSYPTLLILCAYDEDGPVAYLPVQQAMIMESLAVKPGLEPILATQAFRDLVKGAMLAASSAQLRELYYVCQDADVIKLGERHGFEALRWPTLRLKLS